MAILCIGSIAFIVLAGYLLFRKYHINKWDEVGECEACHHTCMLQFTEYPDLRYVKCSYCESNVTFEPYPNPEGKPRWLYRVKDILYGDKYKAMSDFKRNADRHYKPRGEDEE